MGSQHHSFNMLSARKMRLHGMTSTRWTTKDKITQYKGLINLYSRDRKIIEVDTNVERKKLNREMKALQKNVETDRHQLDNAIRGDKQKLRNTLAEHREMQLAYQNSQPKKVIENVHQINFTTRKELDRLKFQMKQRCQTLIDLKLEKALLEDRLKYAFYGQIKEEKQIQILSGKVQDAVLKQEAAMSICLTYEQMIAIMKKDALYFNAILSTIEHDGLMQSKCFLNATKLGQLATEYLDDRRQEYTTLEAIIVNDMNSRKVDLNNVHDQAEKTSASIKQLMRKDSDITTCRRAPKDTENMEVLRKDLVTVEKTLSFLQQSTAVPCFDSIFPCLQEQLAQKGRLRKLRKKCDKSRDILLNKLDHAELMVNVLENTMVESTFEYKNKKKEIIDTAQQVDESTSSFRYLTGSRRKLIAKVRIALRQLQHFCYKVKEVPGDKFTPPQLHPLAVGELKPHVPAEMECDGLKMIPTLTRKLTILMGQYGQLEESKIDEAYKLFETMMKEQSFYQDRFDTEISETSLLEGLYTEVSHQLTRDDIKKQSAEIVAANTKNEDLIPVFTSKKKKKKF